MAYRCKCCGYIFKSSDSDLCPECFTARDDTKCSDMERGHTHFKERSKEKNDFLDDQLREERKAAKEDFGEDYNIRDDSAKNSRYTQNYTGTYNAGSASKLRSAAYKLGLQWRQEHDAVHKRL